MPAIITPLAAAAAMLPLMILPRLLLLRHAMHADADIFMPLLPLRYALFYAR